MTSDRKGATSNSRQFDVRNKQYRWQRTEVFVETGTVKGTAEHQRAAPDNR